MIIIEFLLEFVAYNVGYFFIRLISGGKYPKEYIQNGGSIFVEVVGVIVLVLILSIVSYFVF